MYTYINCSEELAFLILYIFGESLLQKMKGDETVHTKVHIKAVFSLSPYFPW